MLENDQNELNNYIESKTQNLSSVLMNSINKIIQTEGYLTYSINIRDISTKGGNYLSLLKEIDIIGKSTDKNIETNLFIKQPLPESDKNVFSPEELLLREIFTYTQLAELFDELQNEFNVPDEEKFKFVKCYNNANDDSLIFDNMTRKGFKICNRFEAMPSKAMKLCVKQLAKFHGFSTVLNQYKSDYYRNKIEKFKHPLVNVFNEKEDSIVTSLCKISLEYLEGDRKMKLEKYLPVLLKRFYTYVHNCDSEVKCLCHGDYRMSNILVKEVNGEATAVIPIDYQGVNYGPPVIDLIYIIFTSTDQQFRKNEMEDLKKVYYESLREFLQYFQIDVESAYAQTVYDNDFKKFLDFGLIISMFALPFGMALEDDVPELNNELKTMRLHKNFKLRMEEIIDDFIEWGYL